MRQVVLDTETTGLSPEDGHRIIEIGCVELLNRRLTQGRFHVYLNPERSVDAGAEDVHGLSNAFLADKPRFKEIAQDFLAFVKGAELIIHNAAFDVGFINHELRRLENSPGPLENYCAIVDTLALARKKHPGQRNSLDALCKRYGIDNSRRDKHGALLDAEILADVYLSMTGGQMALLEEEQEIPQAPQETPTAPSAKFLPANRPALRVVRCRPEELQAHQNRLQALQKASGGQCRWPPMPDGQSASV
jgi:DNA polymerase-3 subunit epsilon